MSKMFHAMNGSEVQSICSTFEPIDPLTLNSTNIETLREQAISSGRISVVQGWLDHSGLDALFGFRVAKKEEIAHFFEGKGAERRGWIADYNDGNRGWLKTNHEKLEAEIMADRYVHFSPEVWVFSSSGMCKSAQHRGFAAKCRMLREPNWKIGVTLSFGLPDEFADVLDQQAQRRNKEIIQIHGDELLPMELLTDVHGELYSNASAVQTTLSGELNMMLRIINLRASGRDVKAGGQFSQKDAIDMLTRYPACGEVLSQVYRHSLDTSGKPVASVSLWKRPMIAAMLTLAANVDNGPEIRVDGTKRSFILPSLINPPTEEVIEAFMEVSSGDTPASPFGEIYAKWKGCSNKHPQRKASALVAAIRQFLTNRKQEIVPPAIDDATGQPLPGSVEKTVWTCPQIPWSSVDNGVPQLGKDAPAYRWYNFGGLDVGYLPPIQS